jgi:hypothetical protein
LVEPAGLGDGAGVLGDGDGPPSRGIPFAVRG